MAENKIEDLATNLKEYLRIQYAIIKLQLTERISSFASLMVTGFIITILVLMALLFLSLVAGLYFSSLFDSYIKGFLLVGVFYIFVSLILIIFRKKLLSDPIRNKIIFELLRDNDDLKY